MICPVKGKLKILWLFYLYAFFVTKLQINLNLEFECSTFGKDSRSYKNWPRDIFLCQDQFVSEVNWIKGNINPTHMI